MITTTETFKPENLVDAARWASARVNRVVEITTTRKHYTEYRKTTHVGLLVAVTISYGENGHPREARFHLRDTAPVIVAHNEIGSVAMSEPTAAGSRPPMRLRDIGSKEALA